MEDPLEFNRNIKFNFAESGMMARRLSDVLNVLSSDAIKELQNISFADSPNWGDLDLRLAVSQLHKGASVENVLITTGTSEALFLLFRQLMPKKIAMVFPAYQCLYEIPMQLGAQLINLPINWDINGTPLYNSDTWITIIKKEKPNVILINNPHNPSGLVFGQKFLNTLLELAKDINATIVGDEHYRFLADEHSFLGPTLFSKNHNVFVTGSYMKCLGMSGLRIGWCVGNHCTLSKMQNEKNYITHVVSPITEWVSKKILIEGKVLFIQARDEWKENKKTYDKFLKRNFNILSVAPDGGLVTCMGIRGIRDKSSSENFIQSLLKKSTFILPLSSMEVGVYQEKDSMNLSLLNGFRMGIGMKPSIFKKGLTVIEKILKK